MKLFVLFFVITIFGGFLAEHPKFSSPVQWLNELVKTKANSVPQELQNKLNRGSVLKYRTSYCRKIDGKSVCLEPQKVTKVDAPNDVLKMLQKILNAAEKIRVHSSQSEVASEATGPTGPFLSFINDKVPAKLRPNMITLPDDPKKGLVLLGDSKESDIKE